MRHTENSETLLLTNKIKAGRFSERLFFLSAHQFELYPLIGLEAETTKSDCHHYKR